jgi:hypothetical protein
MKRSIIIAAILAFSSSAWAQTTETFNNFVNSLPVAGPIGTGDQMYVRQGGVSMQLPWSVVFGSSNTWTQPQTFSSISTDSWNSTNGFPYVFGLSSLSGSPSFTLQGLYNGLNQGPGINFNSVLSDGITQVTASYINCGFSVNTAGSEVGTCDHGFRNGSGNTIFTMAVLSGGASGCILCSGNTNNFWSIGTSAVQLANIYSVLGTFGTVSAEGPTSGASSYLNINNQDGTHNAEVAYFANAVAKWEMGKDGSNNFFFYDDVGGQNAMYLTANGNMTLSPKGGTTAITGTMTISALTAGTAADVLCYASSTGVITYETTGTTCTVSALAYKNLLGVLDKSDMSGLRAGIWTYKPEMDFGDKVHVGLLADDVEAMDPRCATYDKDGKLQNYEDRCVIAHLVAELKTMRKEINELKK